MNTNPKTHFPLSAMELAMGGVERNGPHVTITKERGAFIIKRALGHPAGHGFRSCKTLRQARMLSSTLRNEKPKA